jgi:hypothetical protein
MSKIGFIRVKKRGLSALFVFTLISFILIQSISPLNISTSSSKPLINDKDIMEFPLKDIGPHAQDDVYDPIELPFFHNTTPIVTWMSKLINNLTRQDSVLFYAESDPSGDTITDDKMYFEDFSVLLDGLFYLLGVNDPGIASYFQAQKVFPKRFYDFNASVAGYYSWLSADLEQNSTIKEFDDNIQPILTFIDWLITEDPRLNTWGAPDIISNQWNIINNLFAHSINVGGNNKRFYNHTSDNSQKYMYDQFLAAIAGFQIHRETTGAISSQIKSNAKIYADGIMESLCGNFLGVYETTIGLGTFDYKRNSDMVSGLDVNIDLMTNAYGILALLEWYIESGLTTPLGYNKINMAEKLFRSLNTTLWNSTYDLFMTRCTQDFNPTILDPTISVKDNAIMMHVLKRLFEITGNFTYFEAIMKIYHGIRTHFYDETYGTYMISINAATLVKNENRNLRTHAYLYRAFFEVAQLSAYLKSTIVTNASSYIKAENLQANITMRMFMDYSLNYTGINFKLAKFVNISFPSYFMTIRYPNGTIISSETTSMNGNVNSTAIKTLNFQEHFPLGTYSISMYCNYTGLLTKFANTTFEVVSGLQIIESKFEKSTLKTGESTTLNFTVNSSREADFYYDVKIKSESITEINLVNQFFGNQSETNLTQTIQSLATAKFGQTIITIEFYNNSLLYYAKNLTCLIASPIELITITQYQYILQDSALDLKIKLKNTMNFVQSLKISLTSDNLVDNTTTVNLAGLTTSDFSIYSIIKPNLVLDSIEYTLNITRAADNEVVYVKKFSVLIKPNVEILSIEYPKIVRHGETTYVIVLMQNYLNTPVELKITMGAEVIFGNYTVLPGFNTVLIPFGEKFMNPYDFGVKYFDIQVEDSNKQVLLKQIIIVELQASAISIMLAYFLPIAIPIIGMVITRHISNENKKRLS